MSAHEAYVVNDFLYDVTDLLVKPQDEDPYQTTSAHVAERIRRLIGTGQLAPGARLPELDLAEQFGVSRGPVREALFLLARDGIVVILPRRGAHVFNPGIADIEDIYDVRAALFALAARRAAESGNRRVLELIGRGVALISEIAAKADTDIATFLSMRTALGGLVLEAAGNRRLAEEISRMNMLAVTHVRIFEGLERRIESAAIWTDIFDRLRARDPDGAAASASRLVMTARDALVRRLKEEKRQRRAET
jgi:DNA-binding GntR family transcriptional regulator